MSEGGTLSVSSSSIIISANGGHGYGSLAGGGGGGIVTIEASDFDPINPGTLYNSVQAIGGVGSAYTGTLGLVLFTDGVKSRLKVWQSSRSWTFDTYDPKVDGKYTALVVEDDSIDYTIDNIDFDHTVLLIPEGVTIKTKDPVGPGFFWISDSATLYHVSDRNINPALFFDCYIAENGLLEFDNKTKSQELTGIYRLEGKISGNVKMTLRTGFGFGSQSSISDLTVPHSPEHYLMDKLNIQVMFISSPNSTFEVNIMEVSNGASFNSNGKVIADSLFIRDSSSAYFYDDSNSNFGQIKLVNNAEFHTPNNINWINNGYDLGLHVENSNLEFGPLVSALNCTKVILKNAIIQAPNNFKLFSYGDISISDNTQISSMEVTLESATQIYLHYTYTFDQLTFNAPYVFGYGYLFVQDSLLVQGDSFSWYSGEIQTWNLRMLADQFRIGENGPDINLISTLR